MPLPPSGGYPPVRAVNLGELLDSNSSRFTTTIGNWTNSGGTLTRDTTSTYRSPYLNASLKFVTTTNNQYVECAVPGTFRANQEYVLIVALGVEETGLSFVSYNLRWGLIGTDVANGGDITAGPYQQQSLIGGEYVNATLRWRPTADRTGVKIRLTRPTADSGATETWHILYASVRQLPFPGAPTLMTEPVESPTYLITARTIVPTYPGSTYNPWASAGKNIEASLGSYDNIEFTTTHTDHYQYPAGIYWSADHTITGDMLQDGYNWEVGPDYVGWYASEYDPDTVQFYADVSGGYYMQLRNRGSKGWSVSDDGATNRRIESYFEYKVYVAGALTTGTDKGGVSQMIHLPFKARIDEVRVAVGTAPSGSNLLVDVNAAGTTVFTTQANRPAVGVNALSLASTGDSTDLTTYTTAPVSLKAGNLYLMSVENSHASAAAVVSSMGATSTLGTVTFTSRSSTTFNGGLNRVSIWSAVPTFDFTGPLFIVFGGAQTGAVWSLDEVTGIDTTTNDGVVQQAVGSGSSTTPLATLAAFAAGENGAYAAHGHAAATATTPGTGWTELSDNTAATPTQALQTAYRADNDTTADATITSAAWGSCAVELAAGKSASSRRPDGGTSVAKNTAITVDIDQIGSSVAGSDLTIWIRGTAIW